MTERIEELTQELIALANDLKKDKADKSQALEMAVNLNLLVNAASDCQRFYLSELKLQEMISEIKRK